MNKKGKHRSGRRGVEGRESKSASRVGGTEVANERVSGGNKRREKSEWEKRRKGQELAQDLQC